MAKYIIRNDEQYQLTKLNFRNMRSGTIEVNLLDMHAVHDAIITYEIKTKRIHIPSGMKGYKDYQSLMYKAERLRNTAQAAFRKGFSEENFLIIDSCNYLLNVLHTYHSSASPTITDLREYPGVPPAEITIPASWEKKMVEIKRKKPAIKKPRLQSGKKEFPRDKTPKRNEKGITDALKRAQRRIKPK